MAASSYSAKFSCTTPRIPPAMYTVLKGKTAYFSEADKKSNKLGVLKAGEVLQHRNAEAPVFFGRMAAAAQGKAVSLRAVCACAC